MHEALTTTVRSPERSQPNAFEERLEAIAAPLRTSTEGEVRSNFDVPEAARLLKTTLSLCEVCLAHVPAAVYEVDGRVLSSSRCIDHGVRVALLENDARYYRLSSKDQWGRRYQDASVLEMPAFRACGGSATCGSSGPSGSGHEPWAHDFTDQRANKTCTVLVEITNACNLACRVCYADSRGDRVLPLERFKVHIERLIEQSGALESVQITGGKPLCTRSSGKCSRGCTGVTGCRRSICRPTALSCPSPTWRRDFDRFATSCWCCCSSTAPTSLPTGRCVDPSPCEYDNG